MPAPRDVNAKKREHLSLVHSAIVVAGGIVGGAAGWFLGEEELSRFAARAGLAGRSLGADNRGPVLLGYLVIGWVAGSAASHFLVKIWRWIRQRNAKSTFDDI